MRRGTTWREAGSRTSTAGVAGGLLLLLSGAASLLSGQEPVAEILRIPTGNSRVVSHGATLSQVSIGDPEVADAVPISAREVVVNGKRPGTTSLLLRDEGGGRRLYSVRVTADAPSLEEEIRALFPGEDIQARAVGNTVVLRGTVRDARIAERAGLLAMSLGEDVTVVNDISVPQPDQVLLHVRFAEVSRNALQDLGASLLFRDGENVAGAVGTGDVAQSEAEVTQEEPGDNRGFVGNVVSSAVNIFLLHRPSKVAALFSALEQEGLFKSLAEPNLLVMSGDSASFLAGGEFPFPVLQSAGGAAASNAVTIQFKEFGIRLNFRPIVTPAGTIRLRVAPEVSALDFANGLTISGFEIPALTSRKAETTVDLEDGQTFAIAGLIDNSLTEDVNKVPILGDIPILGSLFSSRNFRENHTELLVLVTPRLVGPVDESPPVPTGEPETWQGDSTLRVPEGVWPDGWPSGWRPGQVHGPLHGEDGGAAEARQENRSEAVSTEDGSGEGASEEGASDGEGTGSDDGSRSEGAESGGGESESRRAAAGRGPGAPENRDR